MDNISQRIDKLSDSQRLLLALKEARTKLEAVEHSKTEPIAIIGIGCRFPGGANDLYAFLRLIPMAWIRCTQLQESAHSNEQEEKSCSSA
jgi:hypothetical protein